jgi:hypothetical protein
VRSAPSIERVGACPSRDPVGRGVPDGPITGTHSSRTQCNRRASARRRFSRPIRCPRASRPASLVRGRTVRTQSVHRGSGPLPRLECDQPLASPRSLALDLLRLRCVPGTARVRRPAVGQSVAHRGTSWLRTYFVQGHRVEERRDAAGYVSLSCECADYLRTRSRGEPWCVHLQQLAAAASIDRLVDSRGLTLRSSGC